MASLAKKLLAMPYFVFTVFFYYWSIAIGSMSHRVQWANFTGARKDMHDWALTMNDYLGIRILKLGDKPLYRGGRCVYLCNHRSWADFFIDIYLTEGLAAPMSRAMVFLAFPAFMTAAVILKGIVLFKRGTIQDKQKFNKWLDNKLDSTQIPGFLVYPEGHRGTRPTSLPLKRGMLYYAHSRGLPVQVIMTRGKEDALSEKHMRAGFGATLVTSFSDVIRSKDYPDFEKFWDEVKRVWDTMWEEVYAADATGLPELKQDAVRKYDYPMSMRLQQFACSTISMAMVVFSIWFATSVVARVVTPLPPPFQAAAVSALLLLGVASFVSCNVKTNLKGKKTA